MTEENRPGLDDIATMIQLLREGGWREATLRIGDFELRVSDGSGSVATPASPAAPVQEAAPATPPAPAAPAAPAESTPAPAPAAPAPAADDAGLTVVRAQSLGTFWRSPQPGSPHFVEVGDEVTEDSPLGIVEVMKMMTRVTPGVSGVVAAIHVENAELVEFDQPLVSIRTV